MRLAHFLPITLALPLAASAQDYGPTPVTLPAVTYGGRLNAPAGVNVTEFAKVPGARAMAIGPDGSVYVSLPRRNEIVRLADANNDGVAETQEVAVTGLNRPHGMAFHDGWFYIANTNGVVRVRLGADGKAQGTPQTLNEYSSDGGHWTRSIVFGRDGAMYVSIGSTCNICEEQTPDRAAVMRYDANGGNGRLFASGLRNAVGMALHPVTGEIWVSQHERDNLRPNHQDLPPEEINILREGAHYGWPYCHSDRVPNPEFNDPARCASTVPPALPMQAHSAPLGMTFLDRATLLPAAFRGDALVAFHGSWNRDEPTGAKVVRIRVRDGRPAGYEDFITGWQDASGRRWGRPVDVVVHRDGSVLISDDQAGAIYRVTGGR
jgi:glucose/arabinose dehydrogenase